MAEVNAVTFAAAGTPGPVTTSGTLMSVSNAVCFPGRSPYSPMW